MSGTEETAAPTYDPSLLEAALGTIQVGADELRAMAQSLSQRHDSVLRCRPRLNAVELPFYLAQVPWYEFAYRALGNLLRPSRSLHYAAADYYLQDAGSLLALAVCGADRPANVFASHRQPPLICDLCSAPGGKATALVEAVDFLGSGFVLANEPVRSRIPALAQNLARTGSDRYAITSMDPEDLADRLGGQFDLVLVDAPCSGQALFSRKRQTTAAFSPKQIEHSAARQRRILAAAVRLLREAGRIAYSTCTFAEQENEDQVHWLLDSFAMQPAPISRLDKYASPAAPASYRLWPHRHQTAGSFAALLQATSSTPAEGVGTSVARDRKIKRTALRRRREPEADKVALGEWYAELDGVRIDHRDAIVLGWPEEVPSWVESIAIGGPELAHRTGRTWKPAHAGALRRVDRGKPLHSIGIDSEAAKKFMSGDVISLRQSGWQSVSWRERPLGWIKGDGRRGKNHLPAAARLQCELS